MTELAKTASELDAHLAEVLEEYLHATDAGTAPPRAQLLARHPELAGQLEACLASLDFIRRADAGPPSAPSAAPLSDAKSPPRPVNEPVTLGECRILREIGRGGMGIVYEAEQPSQARRVALKVLLFAAAFDPRQIQRFQNEAQAAALLHHPHIVPVYGVGTERDVHYYVMKYIEGHTLASVIQNLRALRASQETTDTQTGKPRDKEIGRPEDKRADAKGDAETPRPGAAATVPASPPPCLPVFLSPPLPVSLFLNSELPRRVAELGIQAAEALEHAHQAGIVHRDIKPGNLMIDTGGNLWITDFGLARFQNDAGNLTLTGDLVGTLRYMSPEQALAKRGIVDQRTDIYSLGVTLYELATLEPAFRGNDRQELLRQIVQEEPWPPRRLNPAIPVALETILLQCVAKEPAARYATAQELADDLGRFLANRPIAAKRPTLLKRVGRWVRRHKPIVATAAAAALLGLLGLALSSVFIGRERDEAERRAQQALRAVDEMYTQVAQRWWFQQPHMEQVQREFLLKALKFYEEFSRERGEAPRWRLEAAKAARRVGDIEHRLGEHAKAAAAYDLAIARLTKLADEPAGGPAAREELAQAHNNQGNLLRDNGRLDDAAAAFLRAQALFAALVKEDPDAPAYRDGLAGALGNLGMALHALGRPGDAEKAYEQSLDVFVGLIRDCPNVPAYAYGLAVCRNNLANLLRDTGRPRAAQLAYEQALTTWRMLVKEMPGMPIFRQAQAAGYNGLGIVHAALGRTREAEIAHRQAPLRRSDRAQ